MTKTVKYTVITLMIAIIIYTPISLFNGLFPFGYGNITTYNYATDYSDLSGIVTIDNSIKVQSTIPIIDPSSRGLRLIDIDTNNAMNNTMFFPTVIIDVLLVVALYFISVIDTKTKKEQ
jgi:hypothetical protein